MYRHLCVPLYLFEKVDDRYGSVCFEHVQRTELGRLGSPRETVQVQRDRTQEVVLKKYRPFCSTENRPKKIQRPFCARESRPKKHKGHFALQKVILKVSVAEPKLFIFSSGSDFVHNFGSSFSYSHILPFKNVL